MCYCVGILYLVAFVVLLVLNRLDCSFGLEPFPQLFELGRLLLLCQRGNLLSRLREVGVVTKHSMLASGNAFLDRHSRLGGMVAGECLVPETLAAVVADEGAGILTRLELGDLGLGLVFVLIGVGRLGCLGGFYIL